MKLQIEIRRPSWLPDRLRWRTRLAIGVAVALIAAVPVAWANHDFTDVPNTPGAFHSEISAIRGAGITAGCGPNLFCPADPIRRDAVAAFLHRGLPRAASGTLDTNLGLTASFTDQATTTITTGGATGRTGFVIVTASAGAYRALGVTDNVRVEFRISQDGGTVSGVQSATIGLGGTGTGSIVVNASLTSVFPVSTATSQTFRVQARVALGPIAGVTAGPSYVTAIYVPFGSTGTNAP